MAAGGAGQPGCGKAGIPVLPPALAGVRTAKWPAAEKKIATGLMADP